MPTVNKKKASTKIKKRGGKKPNRFVAPSAKVLHHVKAMKWWQRWPIYIVTMVIVLLALSWSIDNAIRPVKHPQYGVSFSIKYANELGNDWKANYAALLDDIGFKHLRLMTYWDQVEPENGKYDFKDLDWQVNEAAKRDVKVSLALGLRQPRWPECHEPEWAKKIATNEGEWKKELYSYITEVVNRYKNSPVLESYQLENEAMNNWFGGCSGSSDIRKRLNEEFNMVKQLDTKHPVFMSLSDQHGFPAGTPVPDKYGFSVYRIVYSTNTPVHFYITYPTTIWYHKLRSLAINVIKDRDIYIHELQLEPWGPVATKDLPIEEQDKSMSVEQMPKSMTYAKRSARKRFTHGVVNGGTGVKPSLMTPARGMS